MWLVVMFDLPVITKAERSAYRGFRQKLLDEGFDMLQLSVYARPCPSEEASKVHRSRVREALPSGGEVRVLSVTDHQMQAMSTFVKGKRTLKGPGTVKQLLLF